MPVSPVFEYSEQQILEQTQHAAHMARNMCHQICSELQPGMTESQARTMALELMQDNGITKHWHKPYIRFGCNTLLTFLDKAHEDCTLHEEDIAFVDIGPIINGIEGDVGRTVVFGNNPMYEDLQFWSEQLFRKGREYWLDNHCTGEELYHYIRHKAEEAGYSFILEPAGHLIGAFPHKGWKDGLNRYPYLVEPGLWILEIQIRHMDFPYGAFHEAILL